MACTRCLDLIKELLHNGHGWITSNVQTSKRPDDEGHGLLVACKLMASFQTFGRLERGGNLSFPPYQSGWRLKDGISNPFVDNLGFYTGEFVQDDRWLVLLYSSSMAGTR
jgi:hypothetical protein